MSQNDLITNCDIDIPQKRFLSRCALARSRAHWHRCAAPDAARAPVRAHRSIVSRSCAARTARTARRLAAVQGKDCDAKAKL
eukprot:2093595-Pleurochrysis_carterae.AAC.1